MSLPQPGSAAGVASGRVAAGALAEPGADREPYRGLPHYNDQAGGSGFAEPLLTAPRGGHRHDRLLPGDHDHRVLVQVHRKPDLVAG